MLNQKGEVVAGVMVAMMVIMMLFSGMHFRHRDDGHGNDRGMSEHNHGKQHDQQKEEHHDHGAHSEEESK